MTILRVLLPAPPLATRADAWAVYDDAGHLQQRGEGAPSSWPSATTREAVIAADLVRIVALKLPPLPAPRVAAAATFELEDQLATIGDPPVVAVSPQRSDGTVTASVVARDVLAPIAAFTPHFARVVVEPALAPAAADWTWCASGAGGSYVRRGDGSAFSVGSAEHADALPPELAAAFAQTARSGGTPRSVAVAFPCSDATLAQWTRAAGVSFVRAPHWRWDAALPAAFAAAPDLLAGEFSRVPVARRGAAVRLFRPALTLAVLALGVHVALTVGEWLWLKFDLWRAANAQVALAQAGGLPDAVTPEAATRALVRRNVEQKRRAGLAAPSDAVPLLARAASALSALPRGALKSATYTDGAWTLELGPIEQPRLAALDGALHTAGIDALQAKTAAGYRMRLTAPP